MSAAAPNIPSIDFRILGPLTATVDGVGVSLGGPRQMAVLARLMLDPGRQVSMENLVDAVWDGDAPAQPLVAIRSYVSNLRRVIEPNRERRSAQSCLVGSPGGYRLNVPPESVDWCRFEELVRSGREQLDGGDPVAAAGLLRLAADLWRGEFGAGLPESEVLFAHGSRLDELRLTAAELLFDAELGRGAHLAVAAELEAAAAANPLRERLTELAMLALYRSGRQSDALALGSRLRSELLDRLGVDPSPAIADLEVRILNHDPTLAAPPALPTPTPTPSPTSGLAPNATPSLRHGPAVAPLESPPPSSSSPSSPSSPWAAAAATGRPAVRSAEPAPADPPDPVHEFSDAGPGRSSTVAIRASWPLVGRDRELAALSIVLEDLRAGRSATAVVTGEPGAGRSSLLTAFADAAAASDTLVLSGRAVEGVDGLLWPWRQVLVDLVDRLPGGLDDPVVGGAALGSLLGHGPDGARRHLASAAPEPVIEEGPVIAHDDPAASAGPPGQGPAVDDVEPAAAVLAVTRILRRAARHAPVVVLLDDLQWADRASLSLLELLLSAPGDVPLAIVATWRDGAEAGQGVGDLRRLELMEPTVRVRLGGLDRQPVALMLRTVGLDPATVDLDRLIHRTGGNPRLIRALLVDGFDPDPAVRAGVGVGPELTAAAACWTQPLASSLEPLVGAAAAFARGFTATDLSALTGVDADTVTAFVVAAGRCGLLVDDDGPPGRLAFRHPVLAEVLSVRPSAADRAAIHGAIGRLLLSKRDRRADAPRHLSRSDRAEDRLQAVRCGLDLYDPRRSGPTAAEVEDWIRRASTPVPTHRGPGRGVFGIASTTGDLVDVPAGPDVPSSSDRATAGGKGADLDAAGPDSEAGAQGDAGADDPAGIASVARPVEAGRADLGSNVSIDRALLAAESRTFLAWRRALSGRHSESRRHAVAALGAALEAVARADAARPEGGRVGNEVHDEHWAARAAALDLLDEAASVEAGRYRHPGRSVADARAPEPGADGRSASSGASADPMDRSDRPAELMAAAIDLLPSDRPAHWLLRLRHIDRAMGHDPAAALREAKKLLTAARRPLGDTRAVLTLAVVERYWADLGPADRARLLGELDEAPLGLEDRVRLLAIRLPHMIEDGGIDEAERLAAGLVVEAIDTGDRHAELGARSQRLRLLLWRGSLDDASLTVIRLVDLGRDLGIEPGPRLIALFREWHRLTGGHPDEQHRVAIAANIAADIAVDRTPRSPARADGEAVERALTRIEAGRPDEARGILDELADRASLRPAPPDVEAAMAVAAMACGHEPTGRVMLERFEPSGDRLVWGDGGGPLLGPASLYAGLAASAAGKPAYADALLASAADRARDLGGQTSLVRALAARLAVGVASDDVTALLRVEALTVAEVCGMASAFVGDLEASDLSWSALDGRGPPDLPPRRAPIEFQPIHNRGLS